MAALSDILTSMQNGVNAVQALTQAVVRGTPTDHSEQLTANALVQVGFVRVLGVSVLAGTGHGGLYDAATVAAAVATTQMYDVMPIVNFFPLNLPFKDGLVFKPGAAQKVVIFYART